MNRGIIEYGKRVYWYDHTSTPKKNKLLNRRIRRNDKQRVYIDGQIIQSDRRMEDVCSLARE